MTSMQATATLSHANCMLCADSRCADSSRCSEAAAVAGTAQVLPAPCDNACIMGHLGTCKHATPPHLLVLACSPVLLGLGEHEPVVA